MYKQQMKQCITYENDPIILLTVVYTTTVVYATIEVFHIIRFTFNNHFTIQNV